MEKDEIADSLMAETNFLGLIRFARSGDETAWVELVRRFEPYMQRIVRIRMRQRGDFDRLRLDVGSSDVCQSIFRSLLKGLRKDKYQLNHPDDLKKLLQTLIRFNLATKARRAWVRLRDLLDDEEQDQWIDRGAPPELNVIQQDLIGAIQSQFTEDELEILTLWLDGEPWKRIAEEVGGTLDAVRQRLTRALRRVRESMNTDIK
jgi:RNA polymerase sigma factor (sigma-70 family)